MAEPPPTTGLDDVAAALRGHAGCSCRHRHNDEEGRARRALVDEWLLLGHSRAELEEMLPAAPAPTPLHLLPEVVVDDHGGNGNGHTGNGHGGNGGTPPGDGLVEFTDTRNAARLVAAHGERLRFDYTRGLWRIWSGRHWALDEQEGIMSTAKTVVAGMYGELREAVASGETSNNQKHVDRLTDAIRGCESTGRLRALAANAQCELPSNHETWDPDPYLLNCANGTVDLRSGDLLEHDPERRQAKLCTVAYDPAAACPRWMAFLERIFDHDDELIAFMQRAVGLSLVGKVVEHVLFVLYGTGANGKGTFLNCFLELLGDYGRVTPPDLLLHHDTPQHPTNIAELRGVRFVTTMESEGRLGEALVKTLTGGDKRNARFMYQNAFTYWPSDTFFMATNHRVSIVGNSEGIWRRVKEVPFTVRIPVEERDQHLPDALRAEYSGILAWAVRGCLAWQSEGLGSCAAVDAATASYRSDMDTLAAFLEEATVIDTEESCSAADLYAAYTEWAGKAGEKAASQRYLGLRMSEHGFTRKKLGLQRRWAWLGLRLRRSDDLFFADDPKATVPGPVN